MTDINLSYETAESLRKEQKYAEAAIQFEALWAQKPSTMYGWRYGYCLRKLGKVAEADAFLKKVLEVFPEDKFAKKEIGWILYDRELKPAKEESDLGKALHFASQIAVLNPEPFAMNLVAQVVMKVAAAKKKWDVVLDWANKINGNELSTEARMFEGRKGMSEKETYYVRRARALLELGHYDEARNYAQQGMNEFPDELFLARTAALALARGGNLDGSADELRKLLSHRRADWYIKADLANVEYERGNKEDAFRLMSDAVSNQQDDEYKLGCFVTLGKIALNLDKLEIAAEHVALAKAVRAVNNWSIPNELILLEQIVRKAFEDAGQAMPELPTDVKELSKICHRHWREGIIAGLELVRGTLKTIDSNKAFTFIKRDDGGEDVFVLLRDIPKKCSYEGAKVEFVPKKSFDKKKNREGTQASNVRCSGRD
jgi:tetratricopeptide (TPR) repeat protein/cold shock CspA family protein